MRKVYADSGAELREVTGHDDHAHPLAGTRPRPPSRPR